jgi:hypothetical protein
VSRQPGDRDKLLLLSNSVANDRVRGMGAVGVWVAHRQDWLISRFRQQIFRMRLICPRPPAPTARYSVLDTLYSVKY